MKLKLKFFRTDKTKAKKLQYRNIKKNSQAGIKREVPRVKKEKRDRRVGGFANQDIVSNIV